MDDNEFRLTFTSSQVAAASKALCQAVIDKNKIDAKFWVIATVVMSESRIVTPSHNRESEA